MQSELESVIRITSEVMHADPDTIREKTRLTEDLGADSLELFEILTRIEETHRISFPREEAMLVRTVGDAAKLLEKRELRS